MERLQHILPTRQTNVSAVITFGLEAAIVLRSLPKFDL